MIPNKPSPALAGDFPTLVEKFRKKLGDELRSYFAQEDLSDPQKWRAKVSDDRPRTPDALRYTYFFPQPKSPTKKRIAKVDLLLEQLQPAIWAFCAACEYLRTNDVRLYGSLMHWSGEWAANKRTSQNWKRAAASARGNQRGQKVDLDNVKKKEAEGKSIKQIASDLGVTPAAIYTAKHRQKK